MSQQRSRSRQRANNYRTQQQEQHSTYNYQKSASSDRLNEQRSSSIPKDYNPNNLYPPPYQQTQFRKSPSPIKKLQKQIKPLTTNIGSSEFQSNQTFGPIEKLSLKDINLKKIDKLQQLQNLLKKIKKPFNAGDIPAFQAAIQKFGPKSKFQQIYSTFLYFFIHYTVLDENVYRMFYSIIGKDSAKIQYLREIGNSSIAFYDALIKSTLKVVFDEFKSLFNATKNLKIQNYFQLSQQKRQGIFNKSLYPSSSAQVGSSIRNTLALIRKSMERQKVSVDRSLDVVHPIRQVLKLLKSTIKSLLEKTLFPEQQNPKQFQQNNSFFIIIFSQLSVIIHSKYKHQITAEYEETLNEITILKMKLSQILQEIQNKPPYFNAQKDNITSQNQEQQALNELKITYDRLKKQHDSNYLYLLFVLNLATYNRNSLTGQNMDSTMFGFFIEPLLEEYRKSSQFLSKKIEESSNNEQKQRFFLSIVKNFGIYENFDKRKVVNSGASKLLWRFVNVSYSNVLLKSIDYMFQPSGDKGKEDIGEKLVSILNALSYRQSSFKEINKLEGIKLRISNIKEPLKMLHEQQGLKESQLVVQFGYLIDYLTKSQFQNVSYERKRIIKNKSNHNNNDELLQQSSSDKQLIPSQPDRPSNRTPPQQSTIPPPRTQSVNCLIQLIQSLKQYFACYPQLYYKLVYFIYLNYNTKKYQAALIFLTEYEQLCRQIVEVKSNQECMDENVDVDGIECKSSSEDAFNGKVDKYVQEMTKKIKFTNQCENQLLESLFQDLVNHQSKTQIQSVLEILKQSIAELGNPQQLLVHSDSKGSFIMFMLYQQELQQRAKINYLLTAIATPQLRSEGRFTQINCNHPQFVKEFTQQIQLFCTLIRKYLQEKESTDTMSIITLRKLICDKKTELLEKDIDLKLNKILNRIQSIHRTCEKTQNSSMMLDLEIVVERLLISLFQLQRQKTVTRDKNDFQQLKEKKNGQNQKQSSLRSKLTTQINVTLQTSISSKSTTSNMYSSRQTILSHILSQIYSKFSSQFSPNLLQSNSSLEDLLVLKLKKCISLFYDKINDYMLNTFILDRRLFILRCMTITFYKMKQLADMVLNKYGCLGKGYDTNVSIEMTQFVQDIFFFISSKQALESYLKFITTRDRLFIKTELLKYRSITNSRVDQLIEMVNEM